MKVLLSVALVTRNRPKSLERTLESLSKQNPQPFEVAISDDSDSEFMIASNKELAHKYKCKYISGPQRGLYTNRNFVAKHCTGTHFRTMDDDHEFPENHIKACIEAIKTDENAIWTIGEYYPTDKERPIPAPIPGQLHPRGFSYAPKDMSQYYGISCGASIYPRSVIDDNILNLESYMFGNLYLEYGARLSNNGYSIKFLDSTYVLHHYDENNRSISSMKIINSAKIFSMYMLSFYHKKTLKNKFLTIAEIIKGIIAREYSLSLIVNAFKQYKKDSKELQVLTIRKS